MLSDNSPERRNLILASMAFIVYYAAGGYHLKDEVHLLVVNMSFHRPHVLAVFSWIILVWFCIRFWQKFKFTFVPEMRKEIRLRKVPNRIQKIVFPLLEKEKEQWLAGGNPIDNIQLAGFGIQDDRLTVIYNLSRRNGGIKSVHYKIPGALGFVYVLGLFADQSILGNAASELLAPYLMFLGAVTAPLWNKLIG